MKITKQKQTNKQKKKKKKKTDKCCPVWLSDDENVSLKIA